MSEKSLVLYQEMNLAETLTLAKTLAESGFFKDSKSVSQAVVKILAGREMGIGPIASMTGINVIKGKVAVGANVMAAAVRGDPRYDFRVIEVTGEACEIAFYQNGKELGRSRFTLEDAIEAEIGKMVAPGAKGSMLARFPRNMLYSRAMSNGMRWYCPDAAGGAPIYSPEELGAQVDGDGDVIDVTPTVIEPKPTENGNGKHWIEDENIRKRFWAYAGSIGLDALGVHQALNVEHVRDFPGNMGTAKTLIDAWVEGGNFVDDEGEVVETPRNQAERDQLEAAAEREAQVIEALT